MNVTASPHAGQKVSGGFRVDISRGQRDVDSDHRSNYQGIAIRRDGPGAS